MKTDQPSNDEQLKQSTVMLVSGELDKAILAFEIAIGQAAMGVEVNMWFILYGVNAVKKPPGLFSWKKFFNPAKTAGQGRNPRTDSSLQSVLLALNSCHAGKLPLSQLNFMGVGPRLFNKIMRRKGMMTLDQLIKAAVSLGVKFKICQVCVDAMSCHVGDDLLVEADVCGVSTYTLDTQKSYYNVVI